jgi:hypothetical protein
VANDLRNTLIQIDQRSMRQGWKVDLWMREINFVEEDEEIIDVDDIMD